MDIITLDVGGYKIDSYYNTICKSPILEQLIDSDGSFIDFDPKIFNYILNVLRSGQYTNLNKKYINILIKLKIIDSTNYIQPKIVLNENNIDKPNDGIGLHIIEINVSGKKFKTYKKTLLKSTYFQKILNDKNTETSIFIDNDHNAFGFILNLLRFNESSYFPDKYMSTLDLYGISYVRPNPILKQNINLDIYTSNSVDCEAALLHIVSNNSIINNEIFKLNLDLVKPSYSNQYIPVTSLDNIDYGETLMFELNLYDKDGIIMGDIIDDLIVVIDIAPLVNGTWTNKLNDIIINNCYIEFNDDIQVHLIGEHSYLLNMINGNLRDYNIMSDTDNRLLIKLNFIDKIPTKINTKLYITIENKHKCITGIDDQIITGTQIGTSGQIINCSLLVNYVYLDSVIREKIVLNENLYVYNNSKLITVNIDTQNIINDYCLTIIPFETFDHIKDIFVVIYTDDKLYQYDDILLDMELFIKDKQLFRLDKYMLTQYIPIKYFNKKLDDGIYYYSFSSNPKENKVNGGLHCNFDPNYPINVAIKTKINNGIIKIYSNNYFITSF